MKGRVLGSIFWVLWHCMLSNAFWNPILVIRQSGVEQCETPCSSVMNFVGSGQEQCTPQACCTSTFEQDYVDCFTCLGKVENSTDFSQYQKQLDTLTAACLAAGINVPKLTFPGQDPNRTLASLSSGVLPTGTVAGSAGGSSASSSGNGTNSTPSLTGTSSPTSTPSSTIATITALSSTSTSSGPTLSASASNNSGERGIEGPLSLVLLSVVMIQNLVSLFS